MITDNDIKKLKTVFATKEDLKRFATKEDLDESEARTAFGFADVQKQISELNEGQVVLSEKVQGLSGKVDDLSGKVDDLSDEVKEISQQMHGMEQNIISAIKGQSKEIEDVTKRVTKLESLAFSN